LVGASFDAIGAIYTLVPLFLFNYTLSDAFTVGSVWRSIDICRIA
jgi:hypothetical protein